MQRSRGIQKSVRLQKILAEATSLSRRAAEEEIKKGHVRVNGKVTTLLGTKVDPYRDEIIYSGKVVRPSKQKIYIAFNKPRNTIVSKSDPEGRPLIWDKLPAQMKDVLNSAGRLDFESEGLLILSSDGEFINKITHPRHKIQKLYHVKVKGLPSDSALVKLQSGVKLEDGMTKPARIRVIRKEGDNPWIEIQIAEGKNRQVRRMFATVGHPVLKLRRVAIGHANLIKMGLKLGCWKYMSNSVIAKLYRG